MRRPTFSFEQLRSFVAVAGTEHISQAATSLYLTQAAVTQQVRNFEQAMGLQLFERDGRRVRLTDAGRSLAEACQAALRALEVVDDSARAMRDLESGSIHVGASPTCASYYLPAHLAEFARTYPAIRLGVAVAPTDELNRRVAAGSLDCAVIEGDPDASLLAIELSPDELLLVAHKDHPLSRLRRVTPADLARYRYVRRGPEFAAENNVRRLLGETYDRLESLDLGHPEYVRAATLEGLGFAALPRLAVEADLASGRLKRLPLPAIPRSISAVRRASRGGPAMEAFWQLLTGGAHPTSGRISRDGRRS